MAVIQQFISGKRITFPIIATGGNIVDTSEGYRFHVFTGSGTFNVIKSPPVNNKIDYLVVAGGGNGSPVTIASPSGGFSGGGGAGGLRTGINYTISEGVYTVEIGGAGSNSSFGSILSSRGGNGAGEPGGSGGGGSLTNSFTTATGGEGNIGNYTPPEGNPGGNTPRNVYFSGVGGGGGGGAGSPGTTVSNSPTVVVGTGGSGSPVSWVSSPNLYLTIPISDRDMWLLTVGSQGLFAGGGGGGGAGAAGGPGGGGRGGGSTIPTINGQNGVKHTGGGGGGAGYNYVFASPGGTQGSFGLGGSGIVIIRYRL